jgi:hypothetical protein
METTSSQPHPLLDILDNWVDAQSQAEGACDQDQILQRISNTVILQVKVSAGAKFRTTCELPAEQCYNINRLLKMTWEAVQEQVATSLPCESYKWWEGVLLIGHSSLETKKNRWIKLLAMDTEHEKTWMEWRVRNVEGGFAKVYTIGAAFGVPHCKKRLR